MDDLRAAVATVLALTPATRLIAIDAADLVEADMLDVYAAVVTRPTGAPRSVVADPLRLPFVAAIADIIVVKTDVYDEPQARLREIWRVLAPAGMLVVALPLPSGHRFRRLVTERLLRHRVMRSLEAAMFEVVLWQAAADGVVVRAGKCDGLAPPQRITAAAQVAATA